MCYLFSVLSITTSKISALGKLHDLSGLLGHCIRQGKIDVKNIITIVETIKFFVVTQCTKLEGAYETEYDIAVRARAAYNLRNSKTSYQMNSTAAAVPMKMKASSSSSSGNTEVSAPQLKRVRDQEVKQTSIAVLPSKPTSASAQDILKSMVDIFKDAYTFLKKLDNGEIFMSKVLCALLFVPLFACEREVERGITWTAASLTLMITLL